MARNLILLSSVLIVLIVEINVTLGQLNGNFFDGVKDTLGGFSSVIGGGKGLPLGLDKKARKGLETVGLGKAADMVGFRSEQKEEDREEEEEEEGIENSNENDEEREDEENDFDEDERENGNEEEEEEEEEIEEEEDNEGRKSMKSRKGGKRGPLSSFTDRIGEMDDKVSDTFGMRTGVGRFTDFIGDNGYNDENGENGENGENDRKKSKSSHKGSKAESSASSNAESSASSKGGKGKSAKGKADRMSTRTTTPSPLFFG